MGFGFCGDDCVACLPDRGVNGDGNPERSSKGFSAGATAGVMAAVMVVGVAVAVVWMWRRQWVLPCASAVTMGEVHHSFCIMRVCTYPDRRILNRKDEVVADSSVHLILN